MSDELGPLPQPSLRDYVRTGVDVGLAAVPVLGGSLQTLADAVIVPSISKRRELWLEKLGELLAELQSKVEGFDVACLAGDEAFVTAVFDASRIAMGTHLESKLEMLKNCLARMAVEPDRDDFLDLQMFRFVEALSPEHFVVLQYLANPRAWFDAKNIPKPSLYAAAPRVLLEAAALPLAGTSLAIALRDLSDRALADTGSLGTMMTESGVWQPMATDLGMSLLHFVETI